MRASVFILVRMSRSKSRKADEPTEAIVVGGHRIDVPASILEAPLVEAKPIDDGSDLAELEAEARRVLGERKTVHVVASRYSAELHGSEDYEVLCSFYSSRQAMQVLAEYAPALEAVYIGGTEPKAVSVAVANANELLEGKKIVRC